MCIGFGILYFQDGSMKFIEPDLSGNVSHSDIGGRLKMGHALMYESMFTRTFVRIEFPRWTVDSFKVDEEETLPAWFHYEDCQNECVKLFLRVYSLYSEYKKNIMEGFEERNNRI
jgi:hypothetical protein